MKAVSEITDLRLSIGKDCLGHFAVVAGGVVDWIHGSTRDTERCEEHIAVLVNPDS